MGQDPPRGTCGGVSQGERCATEQAERALFGRHAAAVSVFEHERKVAQDPQEFRKERGEVAAVVLALGAGAHLDVLGQVHDEAEAGQRGLVDGAGGVVTESAG